jgi:hypothetical protein
MGSGTNLLEDLESGCRDTEDNRGQIFADDVTASDVADELAARVYEVRPELRGKGYSTLVTDSQGNEVHRLPVEQVSTTPSRRRHS